MRFIHVLAVTAAMLSSSALAQSSDQPLPDPNDQSDTYTIGGGVGFVPDYEGSDDYQVIPAAFARGRVSGFEFFTRATYLYVDLVRRGDSGIDLDLGPIVGARLNRRKNVDDPVVELLPELDAAIEIGGFAGASFHGLTNPYDTLSFRVDVVKDVGGAHESTVITPTVDFGTPLSRKLYVGASLSMEWVGGGYADYYYSISPADSLASGLPVFDADGGLKHWRLGLIANHSITGDLTGGLSIFGAGGYTRLTGDFKDSPIVSLRGDADQWFAAAGLAYTF
jgi:outer membrane scaffolding protein for murein synthesis (MipA/OmpV family)